MAEVVEESSKNLGPDENETNEEGPSPEHILKQITDCFGETVGQAFQGEDATQLVVIRDLLQRDAASEIFKRLKMSFGQAVKFKAEFVHLLPPVNVATTSSKKIETPLKPTMGQLSTIDSATKRLYLLKRKQVGMLASAHWNNTYPKFNTPKKKVELAKFAEDIEKECAVPVLGFNKDGIAKHIQDFFNEQRRYKRRRLGENGSQSSASNSSEENVLDKSINEPDFPKLVKHCESPSSDVSPGTQEKDKDDCSDISSSHSTLSVSDEENDSLQPYSQAAQSPVSLEGDTAVEMAPKVCKMIVKSVCGKILNREETLKLLKSKFSVTARNLTSLTPSQLLEVAAKKLLRGKYCVIPEGTNTNQLTATMIKVNKEIEL